MKQIGIKCHLYRVVLIVSHAGVDVSPLSGAYT